MAVTLSREALAPFPRFSLANSPYPAHGDGRAVDLYPAERRRAVAPSPVAGEVVATHTVRCPSRPYAADRDHLVLVATTGEATAGAPPGTVARVLHVEPTVAPGDVVAVGEPLGRTVRSGYFAPWVADHLHLGFREPDGDLRRARGSLAVGVGVPVAPLSWDGTAEVVAVGDTYAVLGAPARDGRGYAAVGSEAGLPLDGGLVHYAGGRVVGSGALDGAAASGTVSLLGTPVGDREGRRVDWGDVAVLVDGEPVTGLSLAASRAGPVATLVARDHDLAVGDGVTVSLARSDDPVRLG